MDLLLKATGYLEFCVRDVLVRIPPEIKYVNSQTHELIALIKLRFIEYWPARTKTLYLF